ncbi:MAG: O-antigen ligase family protein [candidate division Zixibacteria bacterium]|nr:O-antigen ligase family protein [Candidatus Tariuqbacter arcticus]
MDISSGNIVVPQPARWNFKYLLILFAAVPFVFLMVKLGYREALAGALFFFFIFLALEYPKVGIAMFFGILMLDFNQSTYHYHPNSIFTIFVKSDSYVTLHLFTASGLICGWLLNTMFIGASSLKASKLHLPFIILILWMAAAQLQYPFKGGSIAGTIISYKLFYSLLLFFIIYRYWESEKDVRTVFYLIIAGISLTFIYGLVKLITGDFTHWGLRVFLLGSEQVQILHLLGIFALMAGLEKSVRFPFTIGILVYLICIVQVFFSTSRASLMGALVTLLVVLFLRFRSKKLALLSIPVIILIAVLTLNFILGGAGDMTSRAAGLAFERIESISVENADMSIIFRFLSYPSALKAALQHPILGATFNQGYYIEALGFSSFTQTLDNTYLKLALSAGFPSAILYITCIVIFYRTGFKLLKRIGRGMNRVMLISLIGVGTMFNILDFFQTNIAFIRATPMLMFAWAAVMKLSALNPEEEIAEETL